MPADLAVNDREELIYLLTEAAEFEHTVMCTYLYAQWSLRRGASEGVSAAELAAIERWRGSLRSVAREEMLHLALVNNLLAAVGAAPHFWRPDFPVVRGYFPADVDFHLAPFNEQSLDHFVYLERPEGIDLEDGLGFVHESRYQRVVCSDLLTPTPRDYHSQGHLYHGIAQALCRLAGKLGERALFAGHGEAQVGPDEFPLPGLFEITDLPSALQAIEEIVLQGEGAPAHRSDSHYARFAAIRDEYRTLREARPDFVAAHRAATNPVLTEFAAGAQLARITEPLARRLADLGNSVYGLMVHTLAQVCAPAPLPAGLRAGLSDVSSQLMRIAGTIGEACARLPIGPELPGVNAGLSFALPRSFGPLVQANAAQILGERAAELAAAARTVAALTVAARTIAPRVPLPGVADSLERLAGVLGRLHQEYEGRITVATDAGAAAVAATVTDDVPAAGFTLGSAGASDNEASTDAITLRFDPARCIHSRQCVLHAPAVFLANVQGPWLHPERATVEQLVHVARSCPSGAITYQRHDGGAEESAPQVNVIVIRENGPYAVQASLQIDGQAMLYRATLCRCGQSKNKPFCDNSHREAGFQASGEPASQPSEPLPERGGALRLTPVRDGPLSLRGPVEICSGTGRTVARTTSARLCRCGASANKPFCDGSHQRVGFRSD
jgi:CDGSH-type Zn-finger protein/uncharacterized Fe-S cluster protein YjdI